MRLCPRHSPAGFIHQVVCGGTIRQDCGYTPLIPEVGIQRFTTNCPPAHSLIPTMATHKPKKCDDGNGTSTTPLKQMLSILGKPRHRRRYTKLITIAKSGRVQEKFKVLRILGHPGLNQTHTHTHTYIHTHIMCYAAAAAAAAVNWLEETSKAFQR
eukprot:scaffold220224_cov20-Prasinocladus_malaysianus.AAC.1